MDVLFFLKERTKFIRQFYTTTSTPYIERIEKIYAGEEPFVPSYNEDDEGEFYADLAEANDSLCVIGYSCVSMLSTALKLYFQSWEKEAIGIVGEDKKRTKIDQKYKDYWRERNESFKKGALHGYRWVFSYHLNIDFDASPACLVKLEDIFLSRNKIEHPPSITNLKTYYGDSDLDKLQNNPFFIDEGEIDPFVETDEEKKFWYKWFNLHVSEEKLFMAISEVECFSEWLDNEIKTVKGWAE
ncbi:hypothetical protein [Methylobacter sp.]|uniref:hypothetical protein n=1 Tax=Methylobacter sp. TaxID=2051955 RepID=UPI002FDD92D8